MLPLMLRGGLVVGHVESLELARALRAAHHLGNLDRWTMGQIEIGPYNPHSVETVGVQYTPQQRINPNIRLCSQNHSADLKKECHGRCHVM